MDQKLEKLKQDARYINMSEQVLWPLLSELKESAINRMCLAFQGGKTDLIGEVAYIVAIRSVETALSITQTRGNKLAEKDS